VVAAEVGEGVAIADLEAEAASAVSLLPSVQVEAELKGETLVGSGDPDSNAL